MSELYHYGCWNCDREFDSDRSFNAECPNCGWTNTRGEAANEDLKDAALLALNAIRGQRVQGARYDEDVKPYDYNLTQATCTSQNRPRKRNPFWWASRELWDKPGLMLWLKFGSWGKHIRILPVPKTLPHLHIYVSLPGLTVETAFCRERYEANCLEYIQLSIVFLKWKTQFNLYAPRTK